MATRDPIERFVNIPLALREEAAGEMIMQRLHAFETRIEIINTEQEQQERPYDVIDGVAIIPIVDVLVCKPTWFFGETTYTSISDKISGAAADASVKAIVLQIHSPGGEVSGLFDLVDLIYSLRGSKPIWSIIDDQAFSAAYAIASATDVITVPRVGGVGSIGVITMHMDVSKMADDMGLKISIVQFGEHKSDYSPFKPLSSDARKRLQLDVDTVGELFVDTVARNRGLESKAVRATEAGTFLGQAGVEVGLADAVASPCEAFAALLTTIT